MLRIFTSYRNRPEFYQDFIKHYRKFFPKAFIYILEQADNALFQRGQLMNVAFQNLMQKMGTLDVLLFVDVDIRMLSPIDFEGLVKQYRTVVIPFNELILYHLDPEGVYIPDTKPSYFLNTPDGGVTLFTKGVFEACNGFSNLYRGWGKEDSDFVRRNKITRVPNSMIHLEHVRFGEWNTDAHRRNGRIFDLALNPNKDGYRQTKAKFTMKQIEDSVFHCQIWNIDVVPKYEYRKEWRSIQ
jgi:predicted glycosyltransferase involved in capsule biosynthesis